MSSTLTNSLLLLNEIRDQLKQSKTNLYADSSSKKPDEKPISTLRSANPDYETFTTFATDEEPLRVQLSRRFDQNVKNSPPVSQKIRIEDEGEPAQTEESYSRTFRKDNTSPSPTQRKFGRTRGNEDVSVDKFLKKSQGLADNLKRLINEEIENFSSECDSLRQKLQNMLEDKQSRLYNESNSNVKTPGRTGNFAPQDDAGELKLHQISQKIGKLMEDIGDIDRKKSGLASTMKDAPTRPEYNENNTQSTSFQARRSVGLTESDLKR